MILPSQFSKVYDLDGDEIVNDKPKNAGHKRRRQEFELKMGGFWRPMVMTVFRITDTVSTKGQRHKKNYPPSGKIHNDAAHNIH